MFPLRVSFWYRFKPQPGASDPSPKRNGSIGVLRHALAKERNDASERRFRLPVERMAEAWWALGCIPPLWSAQSGLANPALGLRGS